jgi:aminopeptidase-like protein
LFLPGTIGSIAWLSRNENHIERIKHGLVVACVGDGGSITYKKSRRSNAEIDRAVLHVLTNSGSPYNILEFSPYGYDERQYCSPAFNLAVGSLTRTPNHAFPEYHTSADNLDFVQPQYLSDSLDKYTSVIEVLEKNRTYVNLNPKCEPQLGKRGLYRAEGGKIDQHRREMAMLWVLNFSDGMHSLLDIADRSGMPLSSLHDAASALVAHGLLAEISTADANESCRRSL